jgi:hypothetical protein
MKGRDKHDCSQLMLTIGQRGKSKEELPHSHDLDILQPRLQVCNPLICCVPGIHAVRNTTILFEASTCSF